MPLYICILPFMKKIIISLLIVSVVISCGSKDKCTSRTDGTVPPSEVAQIESYLASKSISGAIKDPRGFYYIIDRPGSGTNPTVNSNVSVYYIGELVDGTKFDERVTKPISFNLSGVIKGWQYGVPLIQPGGKIRLFLPPSLCYGCAGSGPVPPGAMLIFDISLDKVF